MRKKALSVLLLAVFALAVGAITGMDDVEAAKGGNCQTTCEYYAPLDNCFPLTCCGGPGGMRCTWDFDFACFCVLP